MATKPMKPIGKQNQGGGGKGQKPKSQCDNCKCKGSPTCSMCPMD